MLLSSVVPSYMKSFLLASCLKVVCPRNCLPCIRKNVASLCGSSSFFCWNGSSFCGGFAATSFCNKKSLHFWENILHYRHGFVANSRKILRLIDYIYSTKIFIKLVYKAVRKMNIIQLRKNSQIVILLSIDGAWRTIWLLCL